MLDLEACPVCARGNPVSERMDLPLVDVHCPCGRHYTSTRARILAAGRALAADTWDATHHGTLALSESFARDAIARLTEALKRAPSAQESRVYLHCYRSTVHGMGAAAEVARLTVSRKEKEI